MEADSRIEAEGGPHHVQRIAVDGFSEHILLRYVLDTLQQDLPFHIARGRLLLEKVIDNGTDGELLLQQIRSLIRRHICHLGQRLRRHLDRTALAVCDRQIQTG